MAVTKKQFDIEALPGERWFPLETSFEEDMKEYWGDWGVCSEVDTLKDVLMRRPGPEIDNFDWAAARFKCAIDPERFRAQHDALAQVYRDHGVRVHYVEEQRTDKPKRPLHARPVLHDAGRRDRYPPRHGSAPR